MIIQSQISNLMLTQRLGILLGMLGSGKSRLLNILIRKSRITIAKTIFVGFVKLIKFWQFRQFWRFVSEFKQLYTKVHQLYLSFRVNKCRYRDKGFEIMDTVGFEGYLDFEQDQQLKKQFFACLNDQWVNRLFLVCKYDRIPNMKSNIDKIYRPLQQYYTIMTLIVTHWDQCQDSNEREDIIKALKRTYGFNSFIFSGLKEENNLRQQIYESLNGDPIKINLENTSFDRRVDKKMLSDLRKAFQSSALTSGINENTEIIVNVEQQWIKSTYSNLDWRIVPY